ncbi:MAG TPA: hypothetical protein DD400_04900 [Rhodospirillaceae bacterium]|nr:hypothetical protein [Rhodospirillaceae bacterium]
MFWSHLACSKNASQTDVRYEHPMTALCTALTQNNSTSIYGYDHDHQSKTFFKKSDDFAFADSRRS